MKDKITNQCYNLSNVSVLKELYHFEFQECMILGYHRSFILTLDLQFISNSYELMCAMIQTNGINTF